MHIISKKPFVEAANKFPNQRDAIMNTYKVLKGGSFGSAAELKNVFPSLDNLKDKKNWWVIDIGGNSLRLIAKFLFDVKRAYVKYIVSHAEYDKILDRIKRGKI